MASDSRRRPRGFPSEQKSDDPSSNAQCGILKKYAIYIDINDRRERQITEVLMKKCGAVLVQSLQDNPTHLVSDDAVAAKLETYPPAELKNKPEKARLPMLFRSAIEKGIKIRSQERFVQSVKEARRRHFSGQQVRSAVVSKTVPARLNINNRSTSAKETLPGQKKSLFIRIDEPSFKPDAKEVDPLKAIFYLDNTSGRCINASGDANISSKKDRDFEAYVENRFTPQPKKSYKLNDEETKCLVCNVDVVNLAVHDKTSEHRNKLIRSGIVQELARTAEETRIEMEKQQRSEKEKSLKRKAAFADPQELSDYEYGESSIRLTWAELEERHGDVISQRAAATDRLLNSDQNDENVDSAYSSDVKDAPPSVDEIYLMAGSEPPGSRKYEMFKFLGIIK